MKAQLDLDLHGFSVEQAKITVLESVKQAYREGFLKMRVITGRGNHLARDGVRGKLYQACATWLKLSELEGMIAEVQVCDGYYELLINCKEMVYHQFEKNIINDAIDADIQELEAAADAGEVSAQITLAVAYEHGLSNCKEDQKKATYWFNKAADNGVVSAQHEMGVRYFIGKGVRQNELEAIKFFKLAAEQNSSECQLNLGRIYCLGYGVPVDLRLGLSWLARAAVNKQPESMRLLAGYYRSGCLHLKQNLATAFSWYKKAAELGDAYSQYNLAVMYHNAEGCESDPQAAFYWFQASAKNEDADGMIGLARCYLRGLGTRIELEQALFWIKAAKAKAHPDADEVFAEYYEKKGQPELALEHLKQGAAGGSLFAKLALQSRTKLDNIEERLAELAQHELEEIVAKIPWGIQFLIANYLLDAGTSQRTKKAAQAKALGILEHLGSHGHPVAYSHLCYLYSEGNLCPPNYKKGFAYAEQGRLAGDLDCLYIVAEAYKNGRGVCADHEKFAIYQQSLFDQNYSRVYLQRGAENIDERLKDLASATLVIADLRKAKQWAEQEQSSLAFRLAFFSPIEIEKKATVLLARALFYTGMLILPRDLSQGFSYLMESDNLGNAGSHRFLENCLDDPSYTNLVSILLLVCPEYYLLSQQLKEHLSRRKEHAKQISPTHSSASLYSQSGSSSSSSSSSAEIQTHTLSPHS